MSQVVAVPSDCCSPCTTPSSSSGGGVGPPGPQGDTGPAGQPGSQGVSAFTYVADYSPDPQPVMPAEGANVTVETTGDTSFLQPNQFVFTYWGYMKVISIPTANSVVLQNPEVTATGKYPGNVAPGTSLPALTKIGPSGEEGPAGAAAAGGLLAANNLSDVDDVPTSRNSLGLGDVVTQDMGTGNGEIAPNDGALTNGEVLFASATGIATVPDATARTNLGLGTMAVQDASAVNVQGGFVNAVLGDSTPENATIDGLTVQGSTLLEANLTVMGKLFLDISALQTLAVGNTIQPNAAYIRVMGSGGPVTMTSTPTIANPVAEGQFLIIMGNNDVNTVTLQDQSSLATSGLNLAGGANVTLGQGDIIVLLWSQLMGVWNELCRANN